MIDDAAGKYFRALEGHQHAAPGERVYESGGVADREYAWQWCRVLEAETADRHG
jgi:hypothetical protein